MRGMGTDASNFALLEGKTIKAIHDTGDSDCGLVLEFSDGFCLYFGYNGDEGNTIICLKENDLVIDDRDGYDVYSLRKGLV